MNNSDETLKQAEQTNAVLQAIAELSKKINEDKIELLKRADETKIELLKRVDETKIELLKRVDDHKNESAAQFEAIRQGIVHNSVSFDRLKAEVLVLRADVRELTEEVRHNKRVLA